MPAAIASFVPLALVALLPALAGCGEAASSSSKPPRPVQVERVVFQSENASRDFVGVVRARYETDLGFRVAGKITARIVNAGDRIRVGDVIARLDPEDLELQVASAEAELSAARSSLAQNASDEQRYATLKARGYATVADYERKQAAKDEAEGRLQRAQRALELARNQVAYAQLKADADGVITATLAEPGPSRRRRASRGAACAPRRDGSARRAAGNLARRSTRVGGERQALGGTRETISRAAARALAAGRSNDPHLRGALYYRESRRDRRARHDRDRDPVSPRRRSVREAPARGNREPRHGLIGLPRR